MKNVEKVIVKVRITVLTVLILLAFGLPVTGLFRSGERYFPWIGISQTWAAETAGGQWVYDQAGLFSEEEVAALEKELSAMQRDTGMDVVMVTTRDADGKTAEIYADDFFDELGLGDLRDAGGILYLIDMDNRELYISTYKEAIRLLTDERIEAMLEKGISHMAEGDYVGCADRLIRDTWQYYEAGIVDRQYNQDRDTGEIDYYKRKPQKKIHWYEAVLAVSVSAFCAGSICWKVKKDYQMEKEWKMAAGYHLAYRADAGFRFQNQRDELKDSHITRQRIPRVSSSGGRSGGHFGRSTTHVSGSGRVHGGGGRKF
ncbi:MAG: TPM domain-containing protein [Lachnospiraceae bacterium]|nr:TPM domain-containing protein [Lachnospiraceae bacterium]